MDELVEYALGEKENGREFSDIKKELMETGLSAEQASQIVRKADSIFLDSLIQRDPEPEPRPFRKIVGLGLVAIGLVVTVGSFLRAGDHGGTIVLFYGPILAGIGLIAYRPRKVKGSLRQRSPYSSWRN